MDVHPHVRYKDFTHATVSHQCANTTQQQTHAETVLLNIHNSAMMQNLTLMTVVTKIARFSKVIYVCLSHQYAPRSQQHR